MQHHNSIVGKSPLSKPIDLMAIAAISGYQRYLSPHKGFRCAHRVLHGGDSCSQYVKNVVRAEGVAIALKKSRARFGECKTANQILRSQRNKCRAYNAANSLPLPDERAADDNNDDRQQSPDRSREQKSRPSNNRSSCGDSCNCGDLAYIPDLTGCCIDTSALDGGGCHCGQASHCAAIDCGTLDCAGCGDCGAVGDCGGCGSV